MPRDDASGEASNRRPAVLAEAAARDRGRACMAGMARPLRCRATEARCCAHRLQAQRASLQVRGVWTVEDCNASRPVCPKLPGSVEANIRAAKAMSGATCKCRAAFSAEPTSTRCAVVCRTKNNARPFTGPGIGACHPGRAADGKLDQRRRRVAIAPPSTSGISADGAGTSTWSARSVANAMSASSSPRPAATPVRSMSVVVMSS